MIWIDIKFANLVSSYLQEYKVKGQTPFLANFRCPYCGDSKKKKNKKRGYFYQKKGGLFFKCHNCGEGKTLENFLKTVNHNVWSQYKTELYMQGDSGSNKNFDHMTQFEQPVFEKTEKPPERLIDRVLDRLDTLPDDHEAVRYVRGRLIPEHALSRLYHIDNISDIHQLNPKYADKIDGKEPRLIIPFYNRNGKLIGMDCRGMRNESLRYISVRIDEDEPMIFNLDGINMDHQVYVVEGPLDSFFLPNCCAVGNSDLKKLEGHIQNGIYVLDNQPRNKQIVAIYNKMMKAGFRVCVWPEQITSKDINDMILKEGLTATQVKAIIDNNSFEGLKLKMAIQDWRKI
jgi:hypothetical protein